MVGGPHRLTFKRGQNISFGRILYFRVCKKKKKNTSVKTVQNEPLCCCAKRETNSNFRLRVGRLTTRVTWCSNPCNLRNRRKKRVSLRGVEAWRERPREAKIVWHQLTWVYSLFCSFHVAGLNLIAFFFCLFSSSSLLWSCTPWQTKTKDKWTKWLRHQRWDDWSPVACKTYFSSHVWFNSRIKYSSYESEKIEKRIEKKTEP